VPNRWACPVEMSGRPTPESRDGPAGGAKTDPVVDYVNREHPLRRLITGSALRTRRQIFDLFMAVLRPGPTTSVLDVGVTPDVSLPDSNFLERWYPWPGQITATSVEDASGLVTVFGVRFLRSAGTELPFADGAFDLAFSNAVVEHVGDAGRQRRFVEELCRVARTVFVTTPNRWFPLELHTFLPVVHWLPRAEHRRVLRLLGMKDWALEENLNLLSEAELRALFPPGVLVVVSGPRFAGLRSNLVAWCGPQSVQEVSRSG
jgi:hypothetical protein